VASLKKIGYHDRSSTMLGHIMNSTTKPNAEKYLSVETDSNIDCISTPNLCSHINAGFHVVLQ
jgi:hypothetical protein